MDSSIRFANAEDSAGICRLVNGSLGYPDVTEADLRERLERMQVDGRYFTLVAECGAEMVGFLSVQQGIAIEITGDYFRVIALAVDTAHRREGIGGALLARMEAIAGARGVQYFTLSSGMQRAGAHTFYERMGYVKKSFAFSKGIK